jgi:hypothetical protein
LVPLPRDVEGSLMILREIERDQEEKTENEREKETTVRIEMYRLWRRVTQKYLVPKDRSAMGKKDPDNHRPTSGAGVV